MAIGTSANVQLENEFVHAGWTEVVAGLIDAFNAASRNAIRFTTQEGVGSYTREDFFKEVASAVEHRDPTSVSAQTAVPLTEARMSSVRVPRRFKLVQNTLDSFKQIGMSEEEFYMALGRQLAAGQMQNMFDTCLLAVDAALDNRGSTVEVDNRAAVITIEGLVDGLAKMGDAAQQIVTWVQHSKQHFDLMKDHITNAIDGPANMVIINGNNASLGRPIVVRDAAALWEDKTTDEYNCLGLVEGAVTAQLSGPPTVLTTLVEGLDNIVMSYQAEFDFYLSIKGYTYDETNGGAAPTDATLATGTNWDIQATSDKNGPGVRIRTL